MVLGAFFILGLLFNCHLPEPLRAQGNAEAPKSEEQLSLEAETGKTTLHVMCRNRNIIRTVRVLSLKEGCQTLYSKNGEERVMGAGRNAGSCEGFLRNIQGNLESAGWTCRDVSQSGVTVTETHSP